MHQIDGKPFDCVMLPSGEAETGHGFESDGEAARWVENELKAWLYERHASKVKVVKRRDLPELKDHTFFLMVREALERALIVARLDWIDAGERHSPASRYRRPL